MLIKVGDSYIKFLTHYPSGSNTIGKTELIEPNQEENRGNETAEKKILGR